MTDKKLDKHFSRQALPFVTGLLRKLPKKAEVFVVGGAVRDALLRRKTKDIDLVVRNVSASTIQKTLRSLGPIELVGKNFGVFKWAPKNWKGEQVDIALPRKDHSFGTGGYKDVTTQSDPRLSLKDDLIRRDYTINALAYDLKKKELLDHVSGLSDLAAKRLRTVGEPHVRFHEDYSRMLRGLRLATQLDLYLDDTTAKTIRIMMYHLLEKRTNGEWVVPRETIGHELVRMFVADPIRAFDMCFYHQVFEVLMPEVFDLRNCPQPKQFHAHGDVLQHTRLALEQLVSKAFEKKFGKNKLSALLIFGTLFHDVGKPRTITFPEDEAHDRIRYNNHDAVGAEMVYGIATRLALSVYPKEDSTRHIDPDDLAWMARYHLVGFRNVIENMRPATVEKYFFHPYRPSKELLYMQFADSAATVGPNGKADMSGFNKIHRTITKLQKTRKTTGARPLLSGYDIMNELQIPSGPRIGEILEALRNAQLSGRVKTKQAAKKFIRSLE